MKKTLAILALTFATLPAMAQHYHYGGHWRHGGDGRWFWMTPLVVGGAIVYEASRPSVVVQQPVIVQTPPTQNPNCGPWTETQNPDGTITRTRTCTQ